MRDGAAGRVRASAGLHGFCFYYYWFAGKVLLDLPVRRIMETGKPDFPFCLCWANENWTRRWDGMDKEILIAQQHSPEDDLAFVRRIEPILLHRNYIRVDGKPLLAVYRPSLFPDAKATMDRWRDYFQSRGHGRLFLAAAQTFKDFGPPADYGCEAAIQFPPHGGTRLVPDSLLPKKSDAFDGRIHDYGETKRICLRDLLTADQSQTIFPTVMPSWDNTARRRNKSNIWLNGSPESYYDWLSQAVRIVRDARPPSHRFVFINAWNEWAEGCHLEPDEKFGHAWLNATRLALESVAAPRKAHDRGAHLRVAGAPPPCKSNGPAAEKEPLNVLFVSHDAHPGGAQHALLTLATWLTESGLVEPRFLLAGHGTLVHEFAAVGPVLRMENFREGAADDSARVLRSFCASGVSAVYLNTALAGRVAGLTACLGVPQVAHIHELEDTIRRLAGPVTMAILGKNVPYYIAASAPVAENLHVNHSVPRERIRVVEEYIKCTGMPEVSPEQKRRCKAALKLSPEAKLVLGCGTTDWRKGPDLFVEVVQRIVRDCAHAAEFVWVGGETRRGELEQVRQLVRSKGLAKRVKFIGPAPTPLPYMLAADAFLLSSREDPYPLVCLEAADCGLPVLCFADAGGMPHFVRDDAGAVVPYLDVDEMANQLRSFLTDEKRARARGDCARQRVRQEHDVSVKGRAIYEALRTICRDCRNC